MSQLCHSASWRQNKAKTGGGQFKTVQIQLHKKLNISSYCDVGCQNRSSRGFNLKFYRIPAVSARQKTMTAVVERDKMSGLDRNHRQTWSRLQRTLLIRKGSIKYCLLLFWHVWRFLASHVYVVYEIMSECMGVKQQTDDVYMIICIVYTLLWLIVAGIIM